MTSSFKNSYITSQADLNHLVALIKKTKLLAIDTEFTRQTTYYPVLSIIQISLKNSAKKQESFIVDCLCDLDLTQLFAIIADTEIIKIFHSSAQDLQIFYRQSNLLPSSVMDTQMMANFCGFDFNIGYSNLVKIFFDKKLDKKQQRSDWQLRPLNQKQIEYAFLDVAFLEEIYERFFEILIARNRLDWCFEEMKNFINKSLHSSTANLSRKFSFKNKTSKQMAQIKDLISWREVWAKKLNISRQHFLQDETIEKIVMEKNFDFRGDKEITKEMVDEIRRTLDRQEEFSPKERRIFMNEKQKKSYQEAKNMLGKICAQENFKTQFLITSLDLKKVICEKNFFDEKITGWRYQLFGKELEPLIIV